MSRLIFCLVVFLGAVPVAIASDNLRDTCFSRTAATDVALEACSNVIKTHKLSAQDLRDVYSRRGFLHAKRGDYLRAIDDLREADRIDLEYASKDGFWGFVVANLAPLAAIGTIFTVAIGWLLTYRGWKIAHQNNSALEQEKFLNAIRLEKRKAELTFVRDQIRYLYGPLTALCETRQAAFEAMMKKLAPHRGAFFDGTRKSAEELRQWRLWRVEVLMPLLLKMEEAILSNAHLIEDIEMPHSFIDLLSHIAAYKAVIKNWAEIAEKDAADDTHEIDHLSDEENMSVINFPDNFSYEAADVFRRLKSREDSLLRQMQGNDD